MKGSGFRKHGNKTETFSADSVQMNERSRDLQVPASKKKDLLPQQQRDQNWSSINASTPALPSTIDVR